MAETRTAMLTNQITDISGELVVTYLIDGGQIEKITLAYETDDRELDPYTISYEAIPAMGYTAFAYDTLNHNLALPKKIETCSSLPEVWERATAYYLTHGVLPHLRLTAAQREESIYKFVEPLSQAVRSLSEDTAQLRTYPNRFCGETRFEMKLANGQLQMSDTLDIRLCDPADEAVS